MASVFIDLMKAMSSTILAVCGSSSLTHAPDLPCCSNLKIDGATGQRALARGHAGDALSHADRVRQFGAVKLLELRLVVEQIHLRGPPDWNR